MKKLAVFLAVMFAVIGLTTPAYASVVHGCPDDDICMWNWESYNPDGSGYWLAGSELSNAVGHCVDLYYKVQWDGRGANNRATSLVINSPFGAHDLIEFYDWTSCNQGGGGFAVDGNSVSSFQALGVSPYGNWNDAIGSIHLCSGCRP